MTHHHPIESIGTIAVSCVAGMLSWVLDPQVLRPVIVAAACGIIGGIFQIAGRRIGEWIRERLKREPKK